MLSITIIVAVTVPVPIHYFTYALIKLEENA